ncbi:MAG: family 78 glycoside hydrolase catalytic domain [Christensenellales bacterium]|jgi:alpha-L-rhamnosidase
MRIFDMKANGVCEAIGFALSPLSLSWKVDETEGKKQQAARVEISTCEEFCDRAYDSGKREDIDSIAFAPDFALAPMTRYYWKVTVWADNGDVGEGKSFFETGKRGSGWTGKWITSDARENMQLHKTLTLTKPIKRARAYATAYGVYELYLNGEKCGDEVLMPYYNGYDSWLQVTTFDITPLVKQGENAFRVMLGGGWAVSRFGLGSDGKNGPVGLYSDHEAFLCDIFIEYEDGEIVTVGTDDTWTATDSPVVSSSIYDGEVLDMTRDCSKTYPVKIDTFGYDKIEDRLSPYLRVTERIKPVEIIKTPKDELVIDLGQEITGWVEFVCRAPKGTKIKLSYSEIMQNGCFYRDNLRSALAEYTYISDGTERIVRPYHTFYGFRLFKVEGVAEEDLHLEDFTGCVIHSDIGQTGFVKTSSEKLNRFTLNALWGQRGNFLDTPTDCPQRDERLGWTGDAQAFSGTACFNMDSQAFFAKYLHDMLYEQNKTNGSCPHVVPAAGMHVEAGSCAWGDAATVIPWNVYLFYGDKKLLEKNYPNMKGWVDFIRRTEEAAGCGRLWKVGFHFADWLALDTKNNSVMGGTDPYFIASAYYYYSTTLLLKAAKVLGYRDDIAEYSKLQEEIYEAIQNEYFTPNGLMAQTTQTAYVCALFMEFAPKEHRERLAKLLDAEIAASNGELRTGFVGTAYLNRVLSENGYNKRAYKLMMNEEYPGWLYEVNMGATTVWERWNSVLPDGSISDTGMNSLNHYAYGAVMEWLYRNVAGINPVEDAPGFRKILLYPRPDYLLPKVQVRYNSKMGFIESSWEIKKDLFQWDVEVPFGAKARLIFPNGDVDAINALYPEIGAHVCEESGEVVATVPAGRYHFAYKPTKRMHRVISVDMPLDELMAIPEAASVLKEAFPNFTLRNRWGASTLRQAFQALPSFIRKPDTSLLDSINEKLLALND